MDRWASNKANRKSITDFRSVVLFCVEPPSSSQGAGFEDSPHRKGETAAPYSGSPSYGRNDLAPLAPPFLGSSEAEYYNALRARGVLLKDVGFASLSALVLGRGVASLSAQFS